MKEAFVFLSLLSSLQLSAQFNLGFRETEQTLNFTIAGNILAESCVGGLENPQFSFIDLNLDGDDDLFIFDRSNDVIRTYLYNPSTDEYTYSP